MKRNQKIKKIIEKHVEKNGLEDGRKPILDGITNPEFYDAAPIKILFVLKEAYNKSESQSNGPGEGGWNHIEEIKGENVDINQNPTYQRISIISSCLLRNFSLSKYKNKNFSWEDALKDFNSIAWINVGKFPAPGISTTSDPRLCKAYDYWKPVLLKEIEIINPDVIIFGNTFKVFEKDLLKDLTLLGNKGRSRALKDEEGRLLIDTYHPAVRSCTISEEEYINSIRALVKKFGIKR